MNSTELLYDHYKETVKASIVMQTSRNRLFIYVCIIELLNFIMLLFPEIVSQALSAYLEQSYHIAIGAITSLLPTAIWIVALYVIVRYYQSMIYIERQYKYIGILEANLSERSQLECIERESSAYLADYPIALDMIHIFYTWVIPGSLVILNFIKIILEWKTYMCIGTTLMDTAICLFIALLSAFYLDCIHPNTFKLKSKLKNKILH